MTQFIIDISSYQRGLPIEDLPRQGFAAIILKASEGTGWTDPTFAGFCARAKRVGLAVAAYHYLHTGSEAAQAAHCAACVPRDVPVFVDCEAGATLAGTYTFARALRAAGRRVPVIYCSNQPTGYGWWRAAYLSDPVGYASVVYARNGGDTGSGWRPGVDMWQFGSRCQISGYTGNVDVSAYRGSRDSLYQTGWWWLPTPAGAPAAPAGPPPNSSTPYKEEDDMPALILRANDTGRCYQVVETSHGVKAVYVDAPKTVLDDLARYATEIGYETEDELRTEFDVSPGGHVIA